MASKVKSWTMYRLPLQHPTSIPQYNTCLNFAINDKHTWHEVNEVLEIKLLYLTDFMLVRPPFPFHQQAVSYFGVYIC